MTFKSLTAALTHLQFRQVAVEMFDHVREALLSCAQA